MRVREVDEEGWEGGIALESQRQSNPGRYHDLKLHNFKPLSVGSRIEIQIDSPASKKNNPKSASARVLAQVKC